jgi:hypothetical protein
MQSKLFAKLTATLVQEMLGMRDLGMRAQVNSFVTSNRLHPTQKAARMGHDKLENCSRKSIMLF